MSEFVLTKKAKSDLRSIATYTQHKWGKEQRRIYLRQLDDAFHLLAASSDVGTTCDYIKVGYQKFSISRHLIFYRAISSGKIEIVRVLHKRMDAKALFD